MAEYNSPLPVGNWLTSNFLPKYPPVTGNIGPNPGSWTFRTGYVAPYRSFEQQLQSSNNILGPYCRTTTGLSGRIVTSMTTGNLGFVQQCWYSFPRGPLDNDANGQPYEENKDWWAECGKVIIEVENLMVDGNPPIKVRVAISNYTISDPEKFFFFDRVSLFFYRVASSVEFAVLGGDCGVGANPNGTPVAAKNKGGLFGDIATLLLGIPGALGNALSAGGPIISAFSSAFGNTLNPNNPLHSNTVAATVAGWLSDAKTNYKNFWDSLNSWIDAANNAGEDIQNRLTIVAGVISALPEAANLFINGWLLPNINFTQNAMAPGSSNNPYQWRLSESAQQSFASLLAGSLSINDGTYINGVPRSNPSNNDGNIKDFTWFLTMLNRSIVGGQESAGSAYVDPKTNELAIPEVYGFARGGSISASTSTFLNEVEAATNPSTANSLGAFLDMSPGNFFFLVPVGIPVLALEVIASAIKESKGEPVNNVTNLDAYVDTYFEARITAANLKAGNPTLYNNLVNSGQMQAVP